MRVLSLVMTVLLLMTFLDSATEGAGIGRMKGSREWRIQDISCKTAGYYGFPGDCMRFYRCVDYFGTNERFSLFVFDCPDGTIFDDTVSVCNHPAWVSPHARCYSEAIDEEYSEEEYEEEDGSGQDLYVPPTTSTVRPSTTGAPKPEEVPTTSAPLTTQPPTTHHPSTTILPVPAPTTIIPIPELPTTAPVVPEQPATIPAVTEPVTSISEVATGIPEIVTNIPEVTTSMPETITTIPETVTTIPETVTVESTESSSGESGSTEYISSESGSTESNYVPDVSTNFEEVTTMVPDVVAPSESSSTESPDSNMEAASGAVTEATGSSTELETTLTAMPASQFLLKCGDSLFHRHPLKCELFYECVWNGMAFNINVLSCQPGLYFDESSSSCMLPDQTDECLLLPATPVVTTPITEPQYSVAPDSLYNCTVPGHFPYELDCIRFYRCFEISPNVLKGLLYRCPDGYYFSTETERCEMETSASVCDRVVNRFGNVETPLESAIVVRVADLEEFFSNVSNHYNPIRQ